MTNPNLPFRIRKRMEKMLWHKVECANCGADMSIWETPRAIKRYPKKYIKCLDCLWGVPNDGD